MQHANSRETTEQPLRIGDYRVVRLLGEGRFGNVYLARDDRASRMVTLKVIEPAEDVRATEWRRFRRSLQSAMQLNHPAVASIYDHFSLEDRHHIVMEFVQGQFLSDLLRKGAIAQERVVRLARQMADALYAANEIGVVHRALKPGKVVLLKGDLIKILDFGLDGRLPWEDPAGSENTAAIHYLSPEQTRGERLDMRTDFFSLGTMLYEMITNNLPFPGTSLQQVHTHIQHKSHAPLAQTFPGVHAKLSVLVDWLLQKDPDRRPEHASQIQEILKLVAADMHLDEIVDSAET